MSMFKDKRVRLYLAFVVGYTALELLSWIGYNVPALGSFIFFALVAVTAVLSWYRPGLGVLAVLAELFVGSQGGYMFALGPANVDGAILSLRMGLFLAVFCAWLARSIVSVVKHRGLGELVWLKAMRENMLLWPYVALLVVFAFGALRGLAGGNSFGNVFFDANGYAFYALFPAFIEGLAEAKSRRLMWYILAAAVTVSVAKALAVMYFFSHRLYFIASNMYLWVRDTRVGEVTQNVADFHRVFFQSHLYVLVALFAVFMFAAGAKSIRKPVFWVPFGLFTWGLVAMVLGLSRSYWFGGFVALLVMVALLLWVKMFKGLWARMAVVGVAGLVLSVGIIAGVYAFPFPNKTGDVDFAAMLSGRATSIAGEAAANSRWALLDQLWGVGLEHPVFGSGFGTTVTYRTSDPRLLAGDPSGSYTTFAFEWGYHDLWVKFGVIGLLIYAWFIAVIMTPYFVSLKLWKSDKDAKKHDAIILIGVICGMVAMLATNVFSPYLNHPLGIGLLMTVAAISRRSS